MGAGDLSRDLRGAEGPRKAASPGVGSTGAPGPRTWGCPQQGCWVAAAVPLDKAAVKAAGTGS